MNTPLLDIDKLRAELTEASPLKIVRTALQQHGQDIAISFSGAEDVLLIELAKQTGLPYRVFALDTGRLHPETYRFYRQVEEHYEISIDYCFPSAEKLVPFVRQKGLFSFFEDGHTECCSIRKVDPLRTYLTSCGAWMTGQRRDQSPNTRSEVAVVDVDQGFKGKDAQLYKWNPLANRTSQEVWDAIMAFEVPYNPLHAKGMTSIGCEPCTRATLPGQHEREGRWWWEQADKKECGLHKS